MLSWRPGLNPLLGGAAFFGVAVAFSSPVAAQQVAAAPQARIQATCEGVVPNRCKGVYGFTVGADGAWQAGPDPQGHTLNGNLEQADRQAVADALNKAPDNGQCDMRPTMVPGVSETLVITQAERQVTLHGTGGKLLPSCGKPGSSNDQFFSLMSRLMRKYYPAQFP